eukprot:SAG11_NODE_1383_length_5074_cov_41.695276_4_plen_169_part_00
MDFNHIYSTNADAHFLIILSDGIFCDLSIQKLTKHDALEVAFAAVDIVYQCFLQQDVQDVLAKHVCVLSSAIGPTMPHPLRRSPAEPRSDIWAMLGVDDALTLWPQGRGEAIQSLTYTLLHHHDLGLAVLAAKGLIASYENFPKPPRTKKPAMRPAAFAAAAFTAVGR